MEWAEDLIRDELLASLSGGAHSYGSPRKRARSSGHSSPRSHNAGKRAHNVTDQRISCLVALLRSPSERVMPVWELQWQEKAEHSQAGLEMRALEFFA